MASKLWSAGKKLTLWGALVSSLPFLFMLLMVLSVLSIAFAVPLGCAVGSYVCFRKLYAGLCGKRLIAGKKEGLGLNKNEAEAEEFEIASNEVECGDESEESAERADDPEGPFRAQSEEVQSKSREGLDINDSHGEPEIYEEEKPSSPFQEQNHHVKPLEEEPPKLFYEGQTQSKGDPHAFPSAVGGGQTPEGENHSRYKDEMEFSEGEARLTWGPDANIVGEEQIPEDETRSWLKDEAKASEGEPQLTLDPKAIPMEKTVAEEQTPKDEIQFSLKEKVKSSEPDTQLTSANHHAIAVDEVSFIDIACKIKEEETERSNELQEIPTRRPPREQGAELDSEKLSPIDTKHQIRDLEEEEEEESNEMQEIPSERPHHEQSAELDFEKLSLSYTTNKRREEDEEEDEKGEESNETQGIPSERSSHEQGAELDLEKLSPTETKHKIAEEEEKEEQDAELEENEEGEESNEMQGIPSKRSSHEQGAELDLEMFPPTDTNHKITDEEEEQKSTETGAVPSERSQYEQDAELELAPSTPYTDNTIRDGNTATPETTYYSAAQSVQSESPHKASFVGFEYDTVSRDNDAKEIESATSLEVQVSSGSESDQNSKSTSESTPERDSDDDDDDDDDKNIWEEIHAVRKIVGYKKDPDASYAEEIKALYVFTGVEPPASLKYSFDLIKAKEKLKFLKIVVGVK